MSRTKKGNKGPGYDYCGRRPKSADCGYGPDVKRISKRIERARAKRAVARGKEMPFREAF
jgi:hypothetical protein